MNIRYLFISFSLVLGFAASSQTIHDIEAGGGPGGPTPYYSPQFITIQVGDIVRWTNSGGTHNVDGSLTAYPDNPEGFNNGEPSNSLWTFEFQFDIPGFYGFECSAFDHADTQFGTITVTAVGLPEYDDISLDFYPNPCQDHMNISTEEEILSVKVFTKEMKEVSRMDVSGLERNETIYVSDLKTGDYILEITTTKGTAHRRFIKK